ncbi:MAG: helix-turn-helix transcriptional regulator [Gammaproteobacteria bacterium]|nr:helix-turn-helix transcriptional regulator [Gammaproteobacteria bacterium]
MSIVIKSESTEDFFKRAGEIAEAADKALPVQPGDKIVTFEPEAFHLLMSGKRLALLRYVRNTDGATLESLSQTTGLARTTVSRNINSLEKLGLIQFRFVPPHGQHKIIESVYGKHERLIVQTEI